MDQVLMSKKVSMIIPVYQAKKTLERCVSSCISQQGVKKEQLEIILVDDGSTDGSGALCDELVIRYSGKNSGNITGAIEQLQDKADIEAGVLDIKVFHTANFGVSHARNVGIENANGEYICFVDADDHVSEFFIQHLLDAAQKTDNTDTNENKTAIVDSTDKYLADLNISGYQYIESSILNRNTHVWGKIFLLDEIRRNHVTFKEGLTIGEDLLFLIDLAITQGKKKTVKCISSNDYHYVDNPEGAMKKAFKESYLDELICWREAEEKLLKVRDYISNYAFVSVAASQIMTALLVVGKLAKIDESEKNKKLERLVILKVQDQIKHALKTKGTFAALELGYKIKIIVFKANPSMYLKLYGSYHKG